MNTVVTCTNSVKRFLPTLRNLSVTWPLTFNRNESTIKMQKPCEASRSAAADRFEHLCTGKVNGLVPVSKWKSKKTGLSLYLAKVDGPVMNGYFTLATEAHNDDGLPHTLEHLVFMGSHSYPYKGVLDRLANRSLASGTNAWTDTDHTCYTLTTAGSEGFLNLLPIYLDHILHPTLLENAFITEVHHINGEGEDAGVVYSEMQARENTCDDMMKLALQHAMYVKGCGYRYETGGLILNLRTTTNNAEVNAYHKSFYIPANLHLTITGQIEDEQVFQTIVDFEDKVSDMAENPNFKRPWQTPVAPLTKDATLTVTYPSDEEEHGCVHVAWMAPPATDLLSQDCLTLILDYLTDTANSPLEECFVDNKALCSSVGYGLIEGTVGVMTIKFDNVPLDKLDDIYPTLVEVLKGIEENKNLDMSRIATLIKNKTKNELNDLECNAPDSINSLCIGDALFGHGQRYLDQKMNPEDIRKQMESEPKDFWVNFMSKWFLENHHATLIGRPSMALMEKKGEEEIERIQQQRETLGPEGLARKQARLEEATNSIKKPPDDVLSALPVPSVNSIQFHHLTVYSNEPNTQHISPIHPRFNLSHLNYKFQLDDISTNFVRMTALMDSSSLETHLRMYLPLFTAILFELSIRRGQDSSDSPNNECCPAFARHSTGDVVSYKDVIVELESNTLEHSSAVGINGGTFGAGSYPHLVCVSLQVERDKYELGIGMLRELLFCTIFEVDRLKVWVDKLLKEISSLKRDEGMVLSALNNDLRFTSECNHTLVTIFKQRAFLKNVQKTLKSRSDQIVKDLETVRSALVDSSNLRVHMCADVKKVLDSNPGLSMEKEWLNFVNTKSPSITRSQPRQTHEYLRPLADLTHRHLILGVGDVESMYLTQSAASINSYMHDDLPALLVLIQYLCQTEGPLWEGIRGQGLAYGFDLYVKPENGLINFNLTEAPNIVKAYTAANQMIQGYIDGTTPFSQLYLESAISSLIFEYINTVDTVPNVSDESLLSYYRHEDVGYIQKLLPKMAAVSLDQLPPIANKYLKPLFDVSQVRSAVVCNPSQVKDTIRQFHSIKFAYKSTAESELSK